MAMKDSAFPQGRRQFLKRLGGWGAGVFLASRTSGLMAQSAAPSPVIQVPRRKFGRHDFTISSLGLGGHALASAPDEQESARMVDVALDLGVNFFDNCWDYYQGRAEELMGRLIAGKRDRIFLMTKVCAGHKAGKSAVDPVQGGKELALRMLDESLRRLGTDHIDLWQLHAMALIEQVDAAFAPGGVVEALDEARRQGKVRYVGFTGHTNPDVHLAMLSHGYPFDACQMPLSAIDGSTDSFQRKVLPEVVRQGIAPLAMKSLSGHARPVKDGLITVQEGLLYSLSLPVATVVTGVRSAEQLRQNAEIASAFHPMSREEMVALEDRCRPSAVDGRYENYRRWTYRDGDSFAHHA